MAEIGGRLSDNAFTEMGFEDLDSLVANALKRGRNGSGYGLDISLEESGERFSLSTDQAGTIRSAVIETVDPAEAVKDIAIVVSKAIHTP